MFLTRSVPIMLCAFFFPDRKGILLIRNMILSVAIIKITALFLFPQGIFAILRGEHLGLTEEGNARLSLESDPITTASHLCIQALIGMMVLLNGKTRSKVKKLLLIALIVTLLLFTFMTGSRGPVIGFATIFVLLILINLKKFGSTTTVTLLIILIAIFAFISASKINPFSTERFTEESISTDTRKDMYLSIISSKPTLFGEGVGSFGITTLEGPESAKYPHNMTLELYYETGMFGLILFLLLFGSCIFLLYRNYRLHQDEAPVFCLSCLVFFWIGGQFSGYLLANKGFFIFLVLSTWLTKIDYSEIKTKYTY
jgi:O-antigen ligase